MLFQFARLSVKTSDIFHIKYILPLHKFKFNNISRVITGIIIFHSNDGMLSYPPFSINAEQGALSASISLSLPGATIPISSNIKLELKL